MTYSWRRIHECTLKKEVHWTNRNGCSEGGRMYKVFHGLHWIPQRVNEHNRAQVN